jgi:thioredoxin 1
MKLLCLFALVCSSFSLRLRFSRIAVLHSKTKLAVSTVNESIKQKRILDELTIEQNHPELCTVSDSDFKTKIHSDKVLSLVLFSSSWCGPCMSMKNTLEFLMKDYSQTSNFFQMDIDHNFETAAELSIRSIPSVVLLKNGKVVSEIVGNVPYSTISNLIEKYQY